MFFFIPIGSEEGVRKLPYLTIGLIVLNAIIWIITTIVLNKQVEELQKLQQEMFYVAQKYSYAIVEKDPRLITEIYLRDCDELNERIETGEIIPLDSDDYIQWTKLYNQYKQKEDSFVFNQFGFKPTEFNFLKIFSSLFIHGGFFHLFFNMLFLWLVGCNIEDDWSWKVFLGLYLVSGLFACLLHAAAFPNSDMPLIGASGAIAGVMGAFMIKHYKTKIRFAYFIWFIFLRPFFGTFTIYAGIALPFWFIQQIFGASLGMESGTAYWAHIGGFIFGAVIGVSLKFLGLEKKYIAPMVEESFEKLKVSSKMKEAYRKLDTGDRAGAMPLLLAVISEEPQNYDAPLMLARIYFEKGSLDGALVMYNKVLTIVLRIKDIEVITALFEELEEKNLIQKLSDKNIYNLAQFFEAVSNYTEAVRLYGIYINNFPQSSIRPKAIYRTYVLFKENLNEQALAQSARSFLVAEYPHFPIP
jgi:membrane associated rhomboid family serine protease